MEVIILYVVYVIVFVLAFFIFWALTDIVNSLSFLLALFLASIIGIIVVFIGFVWLNNSDISDDDQIALGILLIISFGIPIFLIFFIFYAKEQCNVRKCELSLSYCRFGSDNSHFPKRELSLPNEQCCIIEKEKCNNC